MSKILVIEPYKILQRAIAVSLFPEHEIQTMDGLPETSAFEQSSYDIVIVDAGALREKNTVAGLNRRVEDWRIPTILLEETISTVMPIRDKLVVLRKPIVKNDLLSALAQCQGKISTISPARPSTDLNENVRGGEGFAKAELEPHPKQEKAQLIELVDVVEEGTSSARGRGLRRKKK
jgi:hypothetical protein